MYWEGEFVNSSNGKMRRLSLAVCAVLAQVAPRDAFYRHLWDEVPFFEVRDVDEEE